MSDESKVAVFPAPVITQLNAPYWKALEEGRLVFQRCQSCGHAWLPPRSECPRCLGSEHSWDPASGRAKLVSWVVYHHAYHDYFAAKLPYNVAVVELAEGPRLTSNIDAGDAALRVDMPLQLVVQRESGFALPRFRPG